MSISFLCLTVEIATADIGYFQVIKEIVVREGPAPYYKTADTLPTSTEVQVIDRSSDWFLIKTPSGRIGWINSDTVVPISKSEVNPNDPELKPTENSIKIPIQLRLSDELEVIDSGFLMAGPSISEKIIAKLNVGLKVKKLETNSSWYKIELPIGLVGWAPCNLFAKPLKTPPPEPAIVQSRLAKNGNLRQKPTRDSKVLATLPIGTFVTLTDSSGNWYKIVTADGQTGWMNYLLFAGKSPPKPAVKTELKKILTHNGNLRPHPNMNCRVITIIPANTLVTLIDSTADWYKVRLTDLPGTGSVTGQTEGWIHKIIFK